MIEMNESEWYSLKASVADAFSDVYSAECDNKLTEGQAENLKICLSTLNMFLEEYSTTFDDGKEYDPVSARLGCTVKLWLSTNNADKAIEVLTDVENNIDEADKEKWEIVHDVTSMIGQFKKDVQE